MPSFSKSSSDILITCDTRLQNIFRSVIKHYDVTILSGYRGEEEQNTLKDKCMSKVAYPLSKHNKFPSMAVDAVPYPIPKDWGEIWEDRVKFYELSSIVLYEANKKGIELRWGGDWDRDRSYTDQTFNDLVHYEIVGA